MTKPLIAHQVVGYEILWGQTVYLGWKLEAMVLYKPEAQIETKGSTEPSKIRGMNEELESSCKHCLRVQGRRPIMEFGRGRHKLTEAKQKGKISDGKGRFKSMTFHGVTGRLVGDAQHGCTGCQRGNWYRMVTGLVWDQEKHRRHFNYDDRVVKLRKAVNYFEGLRFTRHFEDSRFSWSAYIALQTQ